MPVIIGARIEEMIAGAGRSQGTRVATESMPLELQGSLVTPTLIPLLSI